MTVIATRERQVMSRPVSERLSRQRAFLCISALLFVTSAVMTVVWGSSMSAMGGMPMPGDWSMSMAWMRMPGQTWFNAAASFLGMWTVMMMAMMLPSLLPVLWRYREASGKTHGMDIDRLTAVMATAYFLVWTLQGLAIFVAGGALAAVEMQSPLPSRTVPTAGVVIVLMAGMLQFTSWKARHLACCRSLPLRAHSLPADVAAAWRCGLRLGLHCGVCCLGLTAILLVIGVMDLGAMALVAVAITAERLAPDGERAARMLGALVIVMGMALITRPF